MLRNDFFKDQFQGSQTKRNERIDFMDKKLALLFIVKIFCHVIRFSIFEKSPDSPMYKTIITVTLSTFCHNR